MKLIKSLTAIFSIAFLYSSCIKDDAPALGTKGSVYVKILEAPTNNLFFTPFTTIDTFSLFSLRREEVSESGTNSAKTITLLNDTAAISTYNQTNGTEYEVLPDSIYSLISSNVTKSGNIITMTIPSGTTGMEFNIGMSGSKWDVSHKYAMDFVITDSAGSRVRTGQNEIFVTIEAKNKYDGSYDLQINTVGWGAYGISDGVSNRWGTIGLITSGPNSVILDNGSQPAFTTALAQTGFGATEPQYTFDPITNKLIKVENLIPDDGRGRTFAINPDVPDSRYDPDSRTIYAAYLMFQKTRPTQYIYDTLKYLGPR